MKIFKDDFIIKILNFPVSVKNYINERERKSNIKIEPEETIDKKVKRKKINNIT